MTDILGGHFIWPPKFFDISQQSTLGDLKIMARLNLLMNNYCFALVLLAALSGCGGGGEEGDGYTGDRGQVSGTVTVAGQPIKEGCQILFTSDKGYTASAVIEADGKYTLKYDGDPNGLPVGEYLVQLSAPFVPDSTELVDPTKMGQVSDKGIKKDGVMNSPFPVKYSSTGTSGLKFNVAKGENTADFDLDQD